MSCDEKRRLAPEYEASTTKFSDAVTELRKKIGVSERDVYELPEILLINPGDVLFLYTDGVYDGSNEQERLLLQSLLREHGRQSCKQICRAVMEYALSKDESLRQDGDEKLIDDKTVFID